MLHARVRHSIGLLGVAVLVLTLVGAGCRNPFRKKPEEVLRRAQERWVAAESVRFNATASFDFDAAKKGGERERGSVSVEIAGVLVVFSFLIVPAICGVLWGQGIGRRLAIGWGIGALTSVLGIAASYLLDLPTGATVVCVFGIVLLVVAGGRLVARPLA